MAQPENQPFAAKLLPQIKKVHRRGDAPLNPAFTVSYRTFNDGVFRAGAASAPEFNPSETAW